MGISWQLPGLGEGLITGGYEIEYLIPGHPIQANIAQIKTMRPVIETGEDGQDIDHGGGNWSVQANHFC
jgi:hypothetical protein